jgi:uncharacterized protein YgbK (DUF1537 family)
LKVGVLADDLTGAFDTGVQFRNWGLTVEVLIGEIEDPLKTVDVIVIDTESRYLSQEEAYEKVYKATEWLMMQGADRIYKKVDSTLRGNIGAELDAAMDALGVTLAFFAPAYPTYGRTTLAGKQIVDNNPIDKTEYAHELGVKSAEVSEIIGGQSKRKVGLVSLDSVEGGVGSIKNSIEILKINGVEVIVFDVLTEKHLIDISKAAEEIRLFIGSAGLASEIPSGLGIKSTKPILSICGSTRRLSRVQVRNLNYHLGFKDIEIDLTQLLDGEASLNEEVKRCVGEAVKAIKSGIDVSITSSPCEDSAEKYFAHASKRGIMELEAKLSIEEALGEIASSIIAEVDILGVIIIGGATSLKICQKLGVKRVTIIEEIEAGIPLLSLSNGLLAVTKAGGFGVESSLVEAAQRLRRIKSK